MSEENMSNEQRDAVLNAFILNREILSELQPYIHEVNIFDVLKLKDHEIRHSNVLAWLLDPHGSHGMGDEFLKLFISRVIRANPALHYDVLKWCYLDVSDCEIQREKHWQNIGSRDSLDILITAYQPHGLDYVIAVENKVKASEGQDQTEKYRRHIEQECPAAEKMYVFLTAKEEKPSDDRWAVLSYKEIYEMLDHVLNHCSFSREAELIINNYRKVCAEIMGITDEALRAKVAKIYREHKDEIDLIMKYKPDLQWDVADYLGEKLQEQANSEAYNAGPHGAPNTLSIIKQKSYVRFTTQNMDRYIAPAPEKTSCWGTKDNYYYEFSFVKDSGKLQVSFTLVLNVKNVDKDSEMYQRGTHIKDISGYKGKSREQINFRVAFDPIRSEKLSDDMEEDAWKPIMDKFFDKISERVHGLEAQL